MTTTPVIASFTVDAETHTWLLAKETAFLLSRISNVVKASAVLISGQPDTYVVSVLANGNLPLDQVEQALACAKINHQRYTEDLPEGVVPDNPFHARVLADTKNLDAVYKVAGTWALDFPGKAVAAR